MASGPQGLCVCAFERGCDGLKVGVCVCACVCVCVCVRVLVIYTSFGVKVIVCIRKTCRRAAPAGAKTWFSPFQMGFSYTHTSKRKIFLRILRANIQFLFIGSKGTQNTRVFDVVIFKGSGPPDTRFHPFWRRCLDLQTSARPVLHGKIRVKTHFWRKVQKPHLRWCFEHPGARRQLLLGRKTL